MSEIAIVSSIASSLASATAMAKAMLGMKIDSEVRAHVGEIQGALMAAQTAALAGLEERFLLLDKIEKLERRLKAAVDWDEEAKRYQLQEFPHGTHVYVLKAECADGEPIHRICPNCFQQNLKSILQTTVKHSGAEEVSCSACSASIKLSPFNRSATPRVQVKSGW
jgi:hypothetical protein